MGRIPLVPIVALVMVLAVGLMYFVVDGRRTDLTPTPALPTPTVPPPPSPEPTPIPAQTSTAEPMTTVPCDDGSVAQTAAECPPTIVPPVTAIVTAETVPTPDDPCHASAHDYENSIPEEFAVEPRHLVVVTFFRPGESEQITVLTEGKWKNDAGYTLGTTYDYPDCSVERVEREARAHAERRDGTYLGLEQVFTRVDPVGELSLSSGVRAEGSLQQQVNLAPGDAIVGQSYVFSADYVPGGGDSGCQVFGLLGPYSGVVTIADGEWWRFEALDITEEALDILMAEAEAVQQNDPTANCRASTRTSNVSEQASRDVRASQVAHWCSGPCHDHMFEELEENGHTIVHMTTGVAVTIEVPPGMSVDGWGQNVPSPGTGCDRDLDLIGPGTWTGCEATLRNIGEPVG